MTFSLADVEFRPLAIPTSIDSPDSADFVAMTDIRNTIYREISGHDDHRIASEALLPHYHPDQHQLRFVWLVLADGEVVGRIGVDLPLDAESRVANWLIELVRHAWGHGVGSAAHALVERTAREHGRSILQSWAEHPDAPGARLAAPTGFGDIPEDHVARFFQRHGYRLEQIERNSAFDLHGSYDTVHRLLQDAVDASRDYRVVQWFAPTPPEFIVGYAWMKSRMVTDAPSADLEFDEEIWDAARVARHDWTYTDAGRPLQVTAAQHIATGELCAFTEIAIAEDRSGASHQEDTLVLREHRGRKLGTLVKCAGLLSWREFAPDSPRILTYNAEENRPMLDINEAIGFRADRI